MILRFRLAFILTILAAAGLAAAQSAPFRVTPSDIDSSVKDPSKEIKPGRAPATNPRPNSSVASKDLQSIERQTGKVSKPSEKHKTSAAYFKPEKCPATPKINIKGSGEPMNARTRVATNSYNGRLKQKGSHGKNY